MKDSGFERCGVCGVDVSPDDFERGRAVRVLGKVYCPACTAAAIKRSRNPGVPPDFRTPPPWRRHERKTLWVAVELSIYLESGELYDRGAASLANVSLSGALLRALVLPQRSFPSALHTIGIRLLEGPAKNLEIVGRPVRLVEAPSGLELAVEFLETKEPQLQALRKIV